MKQLLFLVFWMTSFLESQGNKTRIAKTHGASGIIFLQNHQQFDDGAKWVKANIKRPNSVPAGILNWELAYPEDSMLFTFFNHYFPSISPVFNYPFKEDRISERGDFLYFSNAGIPSINFFTGLHGDYHTPEDTPDKLNYTKMTNIARLAFALAWRESGILKRCVIP